MKTVKAESYFKKVTEAQATGTPALADRIGQKRANMLWSFQAPEFADLPTLSPEHVEFFLARALETYGRELIARNSADWNYSPSAEEVTLSAAFEHYNQEISRKRALTKETAAAFADFYISAAPKLLGITPAAATAAKAVLCNWIQYSKNEKVREAMHARLEAFVAVAVESSEEEIEEGLSTHGDTLMALVRAFEGAKVEEVSADAL